MSTTLSDIDQKTNAAEIQSNLLAPKLRFKEFEGDWKESELGKLASKITVGIATDVRPFVSDKEDVPLLRNQNIKAGYFDDSSMEYIIPKFDEANKSKRVQSKDVIIVRTGSNMGNACVVPERFKGSQTFTTLIVRPISNSLNSDFLSYHINYFGLSEIQRLSAGGGKPNLNAGFLKSYRINVGDKAEQQKISSFLSAVDEKIQQLTRKKELLEQYKKGVMQNLFSRKLRFKPAQSEVEGDKNGEDFPDWEEKRLGDVCSFFSGGTPASTNRDFYSGTIPFIGSGNIYDSEVFSFITEEAFNSSSAKIVEQGDLLYALYGANSGEVAISKIRGAINQAILCIRSNENIEYLYYVLLLNKDKIVAKYLQGGQGNLSANIIKRLKYTLPSSEEQQKIATYLSSIDTKIESVAKQITQTQRFKKGLLQQMFV